MRDGGRTSGNFERLLECLGPMAKRTDPVAKALARLKKEELESGTNPVPKRRLTSPGKLKP